MTPGVLFTNSVGEPSLCFKQSFSLCYSPAEVPRSLQDYRNLQLRNSLQAYSEVRLLELDPVD